MATTPPFIALGRGNGFPGCLNAVDVTTFDHWTTLGGFNNTSVGSPTAQQLSDSLTNAMKIFWMLHEVVGEATVSDGPYSATVNNLDVTNNLSPDFPQPKDRVCQVNEFGIIRATTASKTELDGDVSTPDIVFAQISWNFTFVRMFLGAEYIGIGISGTLVRVVADSVNASGSPSVSVSLFGSIESAPGSANIALVEVSDIPFVCRATASGGGTLNPNAAALTSSATGSSSGTASVSITSLEFFTVT